MHTVNFSEKFVAFVDILGFKNLIQASEENRGLPLEQILQLTKKLGSAQDRVQYEKYGPKFCPESPKTSNDLNFQITQVSDCVVVSTEISPAGLINLVGHCWGSCIQLLAHGIMCRGYIKRGLIFHDGNQFAGSGYVDAYKREAQVSIFQHDADERGTPFIEIDKDVVSYVKETADPCVNEMFDRMAQSVGELTAIFPFKRLTHSYSIGFGLPKFDPQKERQSVNDLRETLKQMKEKVSSFIDPSDVSAAAKGRQYIRMLDAQLAQCDRTDDSINQMAGFFPRAR